MMLSTRRRARHLLLAIAVCILLLFWRGSLFRSRQLGDFFLTTSLKSRLVDSTTGRLQWELVPVRYPAKSITPLPTAPAQRLPKVQHDFPPETKDQASERRSRQDAVRAAFERCWRSYKLYAWMSDELAPLSGEALDTFGGWSATLVDNLDTLWIMDLHTEFEQAVTAAVEIDLSSSTSDEINVFETTIRHLGGFLSAYDLSGDPRLLEKAKQFGDMLIVAFDTPNRMPITRWRPFNSLSGSQRAGENVILAEIGSLNLEFTRLSQLTGDPKWYDAVDRIVRALDEQQFDTSIPGMWPVTVNARYSNFAIDTLFTLGALSDSLYEYFPKMHALLGGVDPVYRKLYEGSMEAAIDNVFFRPMTPDHADILIPGSVRKNARESTAILSPVGQHLACFTGGMLALGSKLFESPTHLDIAKKLVDGCIWAYEAMPLGIMPEMFRMSACPSKEECPWNATKWEQDVMEVNSRSTAIDAIQNHRLPRGFTQLSDPRYHLRPEAVESLFVLYRITGDRGLLDKAWKMFSTIMAATETRLANAALSDVNNEQFDETVKMDSMESFWMAETLKYFYLIFSDPQYISLDEFVFNTEAHPFKRPVPTP